MSFDRVLLRSSFDENSINIKNFSNVLNMDIRDDVRDFKDDKYISSSYRDYTKWEKLILPGSFDNVFETNDFDGAILFEKSFSLKEVKGDYTLNLGPIIDMEFTYINGEKIGSSLGKKSLANKSYEIPKNLLKNG